MITATAWPHLHTRADGRVWINGTETKLLEVVLDHLVHGWTADQIVRQHPHLTLAQVHSALGYYHDNRSAVEQEIEEQDRRYLELRAETENPELQAKLARLKARS